MTFFNGTVWSALATGSTVVNSVTGTADRITIGGTSANPTIDIASTYAGQSSITTLGTIGTGTWNGSIINTLYGGTGNTTGTATINANLTGPITSLGNATSVASQTGTGSTFVMSNSPTLV